MAQTPVLAQEEYIEQAYFFRTFRDRLADGIPAQEILESIHSELLTTTKLPLAVQFMLSEMKHSGLLSQAFSALTHYFTPFQTQVVAKTEEDDSRLTFHQALLVLEREAEYRAHEPTCAGLFIYQLETLSRNRLGYSQGLTSMEEDGFFDDDWRDYFRLVRSHLGVRDFAELLFARSEYFVEQRRLQDPQYDPPFPILFELKEGKIASASIGKDPAFLFAALQRQLAYPMVPRLPRAEKKKDELADLLHRLKTLETRLALLETETGKADFSQFYVRKDEQKPRSATEGS